MNTDRFAFNRRAVKPMVCVSEGWQLVKDDYWLFLGITFVGALLGGVAPLGILQGPAMCGIYLCLLTRLLNLPVSFNTLFKGFDYFLQSFIATLIMIAVAMVFMVPLMIVYFIAFFSLIAAQAPQARNAPPNEEFLWSFVSLYAVFIPTTMVISMAIHALFLFTYPLIVDRELTGVEAVKLSMRAAFGNFFGVAGLILLTVVLSLLGVMACYVGAIFFLPLNFAMLAVAYRQVFPSTDSLANRLRLFDAQNDEPLESEPTQSSSTGFEPERPATNPPNSGPTGIEPQ